MAAKQSKSGSSQSKPADTRSSTERKVDRLEDEVRDQQIETQTDNLLTNVPPQGQHGEVLGTSTSGKAEKELTIDRVGGETIVSIGKATVKFSGAEGAAALARKFRGVGSNG